METHQHKPTKGPHLCFKMLEKSLHDLGFKSSDNDGCLFMKKGLMALVYVDDVLLFGTSHKLIDKVISDLKKIFDVSEEASTTIIALGADDDGPV